MAQYSFNCSMISRGKGQSATASASYRSGEKLYSERYGETNFYPREIKPEAFIMKPDHAPKWTTERERLWNEVEKNEKYKTAQLARSFTMALPKEMTNVQQRELIEEFTKEQLVNRGMVADVAIHRDDENNPHAHIMTTVRPFKDNGDWGDKTKLEYLLDKDGNKTKTPAGNVRSRNVDLTGWGSKEVLREWREQWSEIQNKHLEEKGYTDRVTHKSYEEQGKQTIPTIHEGYKARDMEKNGKKSDRVEENRKIKKENYSGEQERNDDIKKEIKVNFIDPLDTESKRDLLKLAKVLEINKDNISSLDAKKRMLHNWERSIKIKSELKIDDNYRGSYKYLLERNINKAEQIIKERNSLIVEKYYPEIAKKNPSDYYKQMISEATINKDDKLSNSELKIVLDGAKDNELNYKLKTLYDSPYSEDFKVFQRVFVKARNKKNDFLKENNVNLDDDSINKLNREQKHVLKSLITKENIAYESIKITEQYFNQTILSKYPTLDLNKLSLSEKEGLSTVIDYYGDRFSEDKIINAGKENSIEKYNYHERNTGIYYLNKFNSGTFTDKELDEINNDLSKKEILDTILDPTKRQMFIGEIEASGSHEWALNKAKAGELEEPEDQEWSLNKAKDGKLLESGRTNPLISLVSRTNLYNNLVQASEDNMRRRVDDFNNKKPNSVKKINKTKQKTKGSAL